MLIVGTTIMSKQYALTYLLVLAQKKSLACVPILAIQHLYIYIYIYIYIYMYVCIYKEDKNVYVINKKQSRDDCVLKLVLEEIGIKTLHTSPHALHLKPISHNLISTLLLSKQPH